MENNKIDTKFEELTDIAKTLVTGAKMVLGAINDHERMANTMIYWSEDDLAVILDRMDTSEDFIVAKALLKKLSEIL